MNGISRYVPWIVVAGGALYFLVFMLPPEDPKGQMQLNAFGRIPVVEGGRVKPLDTVARNSLMIISGRQTFQDKDGNTQPAIKWLLDVMASHEALGNRAANKHKIFRIENDQVLNLFGLERRPGSYRYSIEELAPKFEQFDYQTKRARDVDAKQRDLFDNKILELRQHLELYLELQRWLSPLAVPPTSEGQDWEPLIQALIEARRTGEDNPRARAFYTMLVAYADTRPQEFNQQLASYNELLEGEKPRETFRAKFEAFINNFAPFFHCCMLYIVVFLLACFSWVGFAEPLRRSAFWLALLILVVHSLALLARMYIMERPFVFVTNLYSSAVWIGWCCVILCLVLEYVLLNNGIGSAVAAVLGSTTLVIAHYLAMSGDTLEMMQAVLDTNFWLATHVTVVTFGYAATFLAGGFGIVYVGLRVFSGMLDPSLFKNLGKLIYGVICFATLLSFTGTVLGGIWADQSWGRFWGWDPKENGALLIVIWNALILHARWGGMVQQRGIAVLSLVGNIITAWSWFGVNMLGVGLHSYGFMSGAVYWLAAWIGLNLALIVIGLLPMKWLWGASAVPLRPPKPQGGKPRGRRDRPVVSSSKPSELITTAGGGRIKK